MLTSVFKQNLLTLEKEGGLYQNKVNLNLAFTQRLGHQAHNCKMVYYEVQRGHVLLATLKNLSKGSKFCRLN